MWFFMLLAVLGIVSTVRADEAKSETLKKTDVKFSNNSDLEYFKNLTPDTISLVKDGLMSAVVSNLKKGESAVNADGVLLFDENKHKGSEVSRYGIGTYSMSFIVLPTGAYSFGILLGEKSKPLYTPQQSAIYCYGWYNGGGYTFVLSVNGYTKESKALAQKGWVYSTNWYRIVLNIESNTDVSANIIDQSTNEIVDTLTYKSATPLKILPAKLQIVTEVCMDMQEFLRIGRFTVEPK